MEALMRSKLTGLATQLGRDAAHAPVRVAIRPVEIRKPAKQAASCELFGGSRRHSTAIGNATQSASSRVVIEETNAGKDPAQVSAPKYRKPSPNELHRTVHAVILAGGPSNNPLARTRAMPAVQLGANLMIVDIPISNCMNSHINKIHVLTQFNSHTLNTHLSMAYPPAVFGSPSEQGFVDVLACTQTPTSSSWYRGSADAVRRNLGIILEAHRGDDPPEDIVVLSGQALYQMDFGELVATHRGTGADITICTNSVDRADAAKRGVARVTPGTGAVTSFLEKATGDALDAFAGASPYASADLPYEASMGIYVFKRAALEGLLNVPGATRAQDEDILDVHFGHDVIPHALADGLKVVAHHHASYWKDLSSLRDFYEVNLELARPDAPIKMYQVDDSLRAPKSILPPGLITNSMCTNVLLGEGSQLRGSTLLDVVVGCNTFVDNGCTITNSLLMGADAYQNDAARSEARALGQPVLGIGSGSIISGAVVDKNACIGRNVRITNEAGVQESDRSKTDGFVITEGIVVVMKNAVIPDGTFI